MSEQRVPGGENDTSDEMSDVVGTIADDVGEGTEDVIDEFESALDEVGAAAEEFAGSAGDAVDRAREWVRHSPWVAVGTAFGVGALLGLVLRGRRG